jgi:hypothetical protein
LGEVISGGMLVRKKVELHNVERPKDSIERQCIEFAIDVSLGHPRTLEYIAYMIRSEKLNAENVFKVLGEDFETKCVLDPCTYDQLASLLKFAVFKPQLSVHRQL